MKTAKLVAERHTRVPASVRAATIVGELRATLRTGGSPAVSASLQRFFTEAVLAHGWRTADLRRFARRISKQILGRSNLDLLLAVADRLFTGQNNDETLLAVLLLENHTWQFGEREFALFDRWLDRVANWSQLDAVGHYLIGPLIVESTRRVARLPRWAHSPNRWRRRAAAVALIQAARRKLCFAQTREIARTLLADPDEMVQKGLGWLLREWSKSDPRQTVPLLMSMRNVCSRLVLRTACETLSPDTRASILRRAQRV